MASPGIRNMTCLGSIDCGAQRANEELLFLFGLYVELGGSVEVAAKLTRTLGFSDILQCPTVGANDFFRLEKPSEDQVKRLAELRVLRGELVRKLVKEPGGHAHFPAGKPEAWDSASEESTAV